jgi:glycerophosphoryl diester phosphodiesterase
MRILSHRGLWLEPPEKNTADAFARSFRAGFGTETDIRDLDGTLVISHDPPRRGGVTAEDLLALHAAIDPTLPLALNVKADGLQTLTATLLERFGVTGAFVFDMSIPDMLHWLKVGVPVYTRLSDVEPEPLLLDRCAGIWLDAFHSNWWDVATLEGHLAAERSICIVSPELHRREHLPVWDRLAEAAKMIDLGNLMLCTDFPHAAKEFFENGD